MTIRVGVDELISFAELAKSLPRRRLGRPVHPSTVHRWRRPGVHKIRLEAVRIGGTWHTTWSAFDDFCRKLTELRSGEPAQQTTNTQSDRQRDAEKDLSHNGW